ncbi:hypothetical protein TorRG33x02_222710, partial [Trema orientale]
AVVPQRQNPLKAVAPQRHICGAAAPLHGTAAPLWRHSATSGHPSATPSVILDRFLI